MITYRLLCVILNLIIMVKCQIQETIIAANGAGFCLCAALDVYDSKNLPQYRNKVRFAQYNRTSANGENIALGEVSSLRNSGFNPQLPLKVITHGWLEQNNVSWMINMKDAFLRMEDANVVLMDWSSYAMGKSYGESASGSQYIGRILAEFLQFVQTNSQGFTAKKVHLVGFSMGAHIAGIAGHNYQGIDRITGLDPAGPVFECLPSKDERLTSDDADFVDVMHTNDGCEVLGAKGLGHKTPIGHQDFYVNGGAIQPGCPPFDVDVISSIATLNLFLGKPYLCHHHRANAYFTESIISSVPALGFQCLNYQTFQTGSCLNNLRAPMGYPANRNASGIYYLTTRDQANFFLRYISINVTGLSKNLPGRLTIVFTSSSGATLYTSLLSDGLLFWTNTTMLPLPVSMAISDVNLIMRYEPLNIFQLDTSFLNTVGIIGVDVISNNRYCVVNRVSISSTVKKLKLGTSDLICK